MTLAVPFFLPVTRTRGWMRASMCANGASQELSLGVQGFCDGGARPTTTMVMSPQARTWLQLA